VYDKTVRRRRLVLALLVALSLALLTAYFGESRGGALHGVQRGVSEVLSPIQEGANRALKPFRDLAGWFGDTLDAKSERDRLERENRELRRRALAAESAVRENRELKRVVGLNQRYGVDAYAPLAARVIGRSPTVWYATLTIDKGSNAGVRRNQPVVNGDGLVGRVSDVWGGGAKVTLITDHTSGVSAKINESGVPGIVRTAIGGRPTDLLLDYVSLNSRIRRGQTVVTAGTQASRLESLFPPNIPIGKVTRVEEREVNVYQRVHIEPFADVRDLEFVQVLTKRGPGLEASAP